MFFHVQDQVKVGIIKTTTTSTTSETTQKTTRTTSAPSTKAATSWLPSVSLNATTRSSTTTTTTLSKTESTPYPPLTLSLGAWQITEEDLPIYVGSAAGVLLLIILLLGVTTWRCCIVPSNPANHSASPIKTKEEKSREFFSTEIKPF